MNEFGETAVLIVNYELGSLNWERPLDISCGLLETAVLWQQWIEG